MEEAGAGQAKPLAATCFSVLPCTVFVSLCWGVPSKGVVGKAARGEKAIGSLSLDPGFLCVESSVESDDRVSLRGGGKEGGT